MKKLASDLINLFFPNFCPGCERTLYKNEQSICTFCAFDLPKTNFHLFYGNPIEKLFWGKVPIEAATSLLYFNKGSLTQRLIHQLKYKNQESIGEFLGKEMANSIANFKSYSKVDMVLPVPLHPQKERRRGYNQCNSIVKGYCHIAGIPYSLDSLTRNIDTTTQTKKTRIQRFENVSEIFTILKPSVVENKNILLIDDVITTGSTLESAVNALIRIKGVKVSIASAAVAIN
jgi:ComF family protein